MAPHGEDSATSNDEDGMSVENSTNSREKLPLNLSRDLEERPKAPPTGTDATSIARGAENLAVLIRDDPNWLSQVHVLRDTDVIVLLTPVILPADQQSDGSSDPFEPLGRSLAQRHQRVRQVPYTQRNGITSTHLGFMRRGHVVVLCFVVSPDQQIQFDIADVTFAVNDSKPCIIVVCCSQMDAELDLPFPTLIQCWGHSPQALEAAAQIIFGEEPQSRLPARAPLADSNHPRVWHIENWDETRDMPEIYTFWTECVSSRFSIDQQTLLSLLHRPGYAKHYVIRDPRAGILLGFCATYLSYVDQEGERLIASLAILLVPPANRQKGIGLSLHNHAMSQLRRTRGVIRLQLGSTFPRILYGPPFDMQINEEWFRRRGWQLDQSSIHDMVLDFVDWKWPGDISLANDLEFRKCTRDDMDEVLVLVEKAATRQARTGWFDQYSSCMNSPNVKDIILGVRNDKIIATAITYTPSCGSPIASNLPWASRIGFDVGGYSFVCTDNFEANPEESTAIGIVDTCIKTLIEQGMTKMFIDGISDGVDDLARLGFKEWARYRNVWKDI